MQETSNVYQKPGYFYAYRAPRVLGTYFLWEVDRQITSYSTPGFRSLKRKRLPDHPFTLRKADWSMPRTTATQWFHYTSDGVFDRNIYDGPLSGYGANADDSSAIYPGDDPSNLAITRLQFGSLANEKTRIASGSAGTAMGEAGKTAAHIAKTCMRLVNAVRALRKGHLGDFAQGLGITVREDKVRAYRNRFFRMKKYGSDLNQFVSSTWLEYSYGWKPLIQDVYDQATNLATHIANVNFVMRENHASAKLVRYYREENLRSDKLWKTWKNVKITRKCRYVVRYSLQGGETSIGSSFGLENPLAVAWEIVPFSFVADWFLPIGDFLEGLTAYNGLVFHSGTKSETRIAEIRCGLIADSGNTTNGVRTWIEGLSGGLGSNDVVSKNRTVLTSWPQQTFPKFKDPRSIAHAASAIALLQTVFLGSRAGKKGTTVRNLDRPNSRIRKNDVFPDLYSHL